MSVIITGSSGGLAHRIAFQLAAARPDASAFYPFDIRLGHDVRDPSGTFGACPDGLNVLVNCAGINRAEWLPTMSDDLWDEVVGVNAKGIFKMAQWAMPTLIRNNGVMVNIVSNASHMPMTTSLAYNASKGAAHIMTLQLAREYRGKGVTIFGVSPNKLAGTGMSQDIEAQVLRLRGWDAEHARNYQLAALPAGEETNPDTLAEFIAFLLSTPQRHKYLHGVVIPYGA